ncbi:NAD(P)H-dependent oxidoreductase [Peteryoungia ipomoeae]|uniref:NAD(P)H-dependent oxidoreductase n=1 Tax=Peteryoungia ipomoeae TaxID=1210932 RepID=A0A4V4HLW1_9HYPH|nr:NAD(P)H-dependent oxidoreductase [Peteryoungia ipomoeae]THV19756.1 NAD(P)H-dependent oxidoreductase [Peteryoungia ipomoeae]
MHILIVTAHPDPHSYTHAIVSSLREGIETVSGVTHEILDLVEADFDSRFSSRDNDVFHGRGQVSDDVRAEQLRIDRADVLVLVFPVYWWSMPAIMKGWIDRVFIAGWAFNEDPEKGITRLLGRLKGRIVAIGGADRGTYERRRYLDAMQAQIAQGIFGYCGMETLGFDLLLPSDDQDRKEALQRAFEIGRSTAEAEL